MHMADANELHFERFGPGLVDFEESLRFGDTFIWDLTESNPTDEDCAFCDEPEQKLTVSPFDVAMPLAGGQIALKAALGMLRPGYMLGVTREHTTSFAQLSPKTLVEVDGAFTDVEARLQTSLRYDGYIRLEHGSDNVDSCGLGAGACVVHAHQHLIPATEATTERMLEEGIEWQELNEYSQLSELKGKPYLYVGYEGKHHVIPAPKIRSQWGRRILAAEDGHTDWDWVLFSGTINLLQTWISLRMIPQGQMIVHWNPHGESSAEFMPRLQPRGDGLIK